MTSRERVTAALKHIAPDRTPIFEYVLLPPVAETLLGCKYIDYSGDQDGWISTGRELGWETAVRRYAQDRVELAARLGHDMLYVTPCPPSNSLLARPEAAQGPGGRASSSSGPVERMMERNMLRESSPSHFTDEIFFVYDCIKRELAERSMDLPVLAPAYAHGVWTDIDLMQTMLLEPEVAHRHFALATEGAMRLIDRYIKLDLDLVGIGGDFAGNRPIISPAAYRVFIVPEMQILSGHIRNAGKWSVNASDGNLWDVIDDFLIGCGVDGYLEIDRNAGMELGRLKAAYGDKITFFGNMDCGSLLSFGTPEEIRRAALECLEDGAGSGGHVFCASNAITESVPLENYLAMVGAYRDYCGLPPLSVV